LRILTGSLDSPPLFGLPDKAFFCQNLPSGLSQIFFESSVVFVFLLGSMALSACVPQGWRGLFFFFSASVSR